MWLEVGSTNNDAAVIADHFLGCVCQMKGTARIVRTDLGTENVKVEVLQKLFRANGRDSFSGDKSFMNGKSTANQRGGHICGILTWIGGLTFSRTYVTAVISRITVKCTCMFKNKNRQKAILT
ncbi:unnamed protein product [Porites lobata]|uniref:Uncharacterized protein n=1 Tax=Porites lobata TaxID=104759 RepID=A0ABN8RQR4_9CNID|nr:unnamed protein product [Porites lobata]